MMTIVARVEIYSIWSFFFYKWYLIVEADNEQKIVSDNRNKQWTEEWCFCCLFWLAQEWWSLMFMFICCEVINFYQFISFIFCVIFSFLSSSTFILAFNLHFYSFCRVVLYNFFKYHDHSEYESTSWFNDDELMISWMKMKKFKRSE